LRSVSQSSPSPQEQDGPRTPCSFLKKFPANMPSNAEIGALKQRVWRPRGSLQGSRIGQKIFFLNAELKQPVGHESAGLLPRWCHRPDAQSPMVRVESEFHPWQILFRCSVSANEHSNSVIGDATITWWSREINSTDLLFAGTLMSAQSGLRK
jgi:hypothetical protein